MSRAYTAQVLRAREQARPRWHAEQAHPGLDVFFGGTLVETWRWGHVPGMGPVWACFPADHAMPTRYSSTRPDRYGQVA